MWLWARFRGAGASDATERRQMNTAIRERPQPSESVRSGALEAVVKDFCLAC